METLGCFGESRTALMKGRLIRHSGNAYVLACSGSIKDSGLGHDSLKSKSRNNSAACFLIFFEQRTVFRTPTGVYHSVTIYGLITGLAFSHA